jgi:Amt family ammonium transporter
VAGLVAITPASGFVGPVASILIGAVGGVLCFFACNLKSRFGYDDSLDVVGVHGVGGTWGALATGIFATRLVNEAGGDGLLYGNSKQLGVQLVAVLVTWVLGFVMTTIILKVLDATMGLRVTDEDEMAGLDLSQHSETAYALGGSAAYGEYSMGGGSHGAFESMKPAEAKPRASH